MGSENFRNITHRYDDYHGIFFAFQTDDLNSRKHLLHRVAEVKRSATTTVFSLIGTKSDLVSELTHTWEREKDIICTIFRVQTTLEAEELGTFSIAIQQFCRFRVHMGFGPPRNRSSHFRNGSRLIETASTAS